MDVVLSHGAEINLATLGDEDRRKVHAWMDHLRNWEKDSFVRSRSMKIDVPGPEEVFVLKTSTDLRIFFVLHATCLEVTDIARQSSLEKVRQAS